MGQKKIMTNHAIPAPLPWKPSLTRTDIMGAILRGARKFGHNRVILVDGDGTEGSYKTVLRGAFAIGSNLSRRFNKDETVGVMLPTGIGAVVGFCAVLVAGRVPAMINFTSGTANIRASLKAAGITKILTAHKFIELGEMQPLVDDLSPDIEFIYLEDVREDLNLIDKISAAEADSSHCCPPNDHNSGR